MSSKVHVQDNSVAERRLRPIYEWLDSGNNKKALQECDKVLKKTPNLHCAKALKALSTLRIGKEADCVAILDTLTAENPADDATLQAMTLCYRELQNLDKICRIYEAAVKIDPTNEELHTHLFMSYVRISEFKLQQQSAMTLYKLKPKNPYYCWAVMSIILQATRGPGANDAQKRSLWLSLAERMIDKLISDNKLEAEQEVQLYLMILELQDKFQEALDVIEGPLGAKLVLGTLLLNKLPYLIKLKRWCDINLVCKRILADNMDKWDVWKIYINSVFELGTRELNNHNHEGPENDLDVVDDSPEKAHEFICRLVENGADNGYLLRAPYLARFELCSKLVAQGLDTTDLLGETPELFIEYFRKFGHKPCCVSDLRIYLDLLNQEKKTELSSRLIKDVGISSTSVPQSEQQMHRHISSLQLSRLCGNHRNLSPDHLQALVTALSLHYQHGYQTYGTNLLSTDPGPSDAYGALAAHVLYDLAQLTESSSPIVMALVLLENLLKNSPNSFGAKLLCVRLYHTLGGGIGAQQSYESLDVKHLQLDSLGYIHCGRLPTTGLFTAASYIYDTTLKFFSSNYKDSSDHLTFSYKYGSFIKLEEFMDFRERMNNSLHYTITAIDKIILLVMQCSSIEGLFNIDTSFKESKIDWEVLRDNQDVSVYVSWDPEQINGIPKGSELIEELFRQNLTFLKLRTQILWALSSAIDIVKSTDGTRNKFVDDLSEIMKDWEKLHSSALATKYVPISQNRVTLPLPSRLHSHLSQPYFEILTRLFHLLLGIAREDFDSVSPIATCVRKRFAEMIDSIGDSVTQQQNSEDQFWSRRAVMEDAVAVVEIVGIASAVCAMCNELVRPPHGKKAKRKNSDAKIRHCLAELAEELKTNVARFEVCLESWRSTDVIKNLNDRLGAVNLNVDEQNGVLENLKNSHSTAVKEIRTVLKSKVRFLSLNS